MRLLLSGYYGLGNLGDEAILAGLAPAVAQRGLELTVLSGDPQATTVLHGVRAVNRVAGAPGALLRADALVSGGGGLLQDATSGRSLDYYLGLLRAAKLLGKRTAVFAQSLGPLSASGRHKVARALRGVPVAVRDAPSLQLAAELGLSATLVADPALLLPLPDTTVPIGGAARSDQALVLLIPRGGHERFNAALTTIAEALVAQGERVCALAMHPSLDDAAVAGLRAAVPAVETVRAATPQQALALIASAALVVSVRLHGCILAASARVPFVALSYDPKVAGFAELAGAEVVEPTAQEELLLAACRRAAPLSEQRRAELVADARRGVDWLCERLGA